MDIFNLITWLSLLVALLGGTAAAVGLFFQPAGEPYSFTTLRGQTAQIYNQGIYRFDTVFTGAGFKGQDAVVLFLGVPLLLVSVYLFQRGSMIGQLLLVGALGYFLYVYASMSLGAAYNRLFLLYIVTFSTSLFAFVAAFSAVDPDLIAALLPGGMPRAGLAIFMFLAGAITLFVWGAPLVAALQSGNPPDRMDSYTTMVTYALDLAIITPATILCGVLVLQNNPLGYLIALPLLTLVILLAPQIILSTIFQRGAGVPFTTGEMVGPVAGFVVLGLAAVWLLVLTLQAMAGIA